MDMILSMQEISLEHLKGEQLTLAMPDNDEPIRWEPLVLTREKLAYLWEQIKNVPQVFDDFSRDDFEQFAGKFFIPNNVFVDIGPGVGLGAGFGVRPGMDAVLHLVMFDKRLRGREPVFKEIIQHYFSTLKLRRMTACISSDNPVGIKLVKRLGFKEEGCIRQAIKRDGKFHDQHIFGMLREEFRYDS